MRRRHSKEEKANILEQFRASGQTLIDFSKAHGITDRTLRLWRSEERRNKNITNEAGVISCGNNRPKQPTVITAQHELDYVVRQMNQRPERPAPRVAYVQTIIMC